MSLPAVKEPLDIPQIVQRYANGESMMDIAPDFGVSSRTLYRWLLTDLGDEKYQELITDCLVYRIHDADKDLHLAADMCQVTRARDEARFARMDFERRRPHLYGIKKEMKITGQLPSLVINVVPPQQIGVVHDVPFPSH